MQESTREHLFIPAHDFLLICLHQPQYCFCLHYRNQGGRHLAYMRSMSSLENSMVISYYFHYPVQAQAHGINICKGDRSKICRGDRSKICRGDRSKICRGDRSKICRGDRSKICRGDRSKICRGDRSKICRGDRSKICRGDRSKIAQKIFCRKNRVTYLLCPRALRAYVPLCLKLLRAYVPKSLLLLRV